MNFKLLLKPFQLKNLALRNRIVMAPMLSRLCDPDGIVSQKLIDYYAERAKGAAGIIIVEYCYIDEKESKANQGQLGVYSDQLIAGLGDLAEAIQEWGAKAILQICHSGRCSSAKYMGHQPIAPSAMPSYTGEMAREMTLQDIKAAIESFAESALRAKTAGFDGVELHGAHGYLFAQFMSPGENKRIDAYGGTVDGRLKLAIDVIESIRSYVGREFPIIFKISGDEMYAGGRTIEETQLMAWLLAKAGVDCITVSRGSINASIHWILPPTGVAPATWVTEDAQKVKQAVDIPICAVGRITDPLMAEFILQSGKADLIAFGG